MRLYVENAGYPFADEMVALMIQYPQVYADVSTITWLIPRTAFHDYLERLVRAGFGKHLMFGSDQMIWPEAIGIGVESVDAAAFLTRQQRSDIFNIAFLSPSAAPPAPIRSSRRSGANPLSDTHADCSPPVARAARRPSRW